MGGFGSAVCEALADMDLRVPTLRLAVPDCFVAQGAMDKLLSDVGLTPAGVSAAVLGRLEGVPTASADLASEGDTRDAAPHRRRTR